MQNKKIVKKIYICQYICQVFTFLLKTESWLWKKLDWSKVTVICYAGWVDDELTRFAHQKNVKGRWSDHLKLSKKSGYFQSSSLPTTQNTNYSTPRIGRGG